MEAIISSLRWTVVYDKLPVFTPLIEAASQINALASLGDERTARMLLSMVLAYPLGIITPSLPGASLRHLWSLLVGVLLVQFVFGEGWLHLFFPSAAVYLVLAFGRLTGLARHYRHVIAAILSFAYLIFRHLSRSSVKSNTIDDSTLTMVLVVKLYTLSYNLYDAESYAGEKGELEGREKKEEDEGKKAALRKKLEVVEKRGSRAVQHLPNPLEFLAYAFNFPTVFCGPAFEFKEYKAAQDQAPDGAGAGAGYLATRFLPGLWKLVQGLVWFVATAVLQAWYPTTDIYPKSRADSGTSRLALFAYIFMSIWVSRFKYYAVWKLSDGAAVLAGFGWRKPKHASKGKRNPVVEDVEDVLGIKFPSGATDTLALGGGVTPDWEGASNCNAITVETRNSIQDQISHWNIHVQSWLANYIAFRLPPSVSRPVTFLASAFWHGFYPGYYVAFFTVWLFQDSARNFVAAIDPQEKFTSRGLLGPKVGGKYAWPSLVRVVVWLAQWFVITSAMTYAGASFVIVGEDDRYPGLSIWERISSIYGRMYWAGHISALVFLGLGILLAPKKEKKEKEGSGVAKGGKASKGASAPN